MEEDEPYIAGDAEFELIDDFLVGLETGARLALTADVLLQGDDPDDPSEPTAPELVEPHLDTEKQHGPLPEKSGPSKPEPLRHIRPKKSKKQLQFNLADLQSVSVEGSSPATNYSPWCSGRGRGNRMRLIVFTDAIGTI